MTDMAAALGLPQLAKIEEHWRQREQVWSQYNERLKGLPLLLPCSTEPESRHAYHLYTPLLVLEELRRGGRKSSRRWRLRTSASAFTTFRCISSPITGSSLGLWTPIFPTPAFVGERTCRCLSRRPMSEQDVSDVAAALTRIFRYYAVSA